MFGDAAVACSKVVPMVDIVCSMVRTKVLVNQFKKFFSYVCFNVFIGRELNHTMFLSRLLFFCGY